MPKKLTIEQINSLKPDNSRLTAISFSGYMTYSNGSKIIMVDCECTCGAKKKLPASRVAKGDRLSCGCLNSDRIIAINKSRIKTVRAKKKANYLRIVWRNMISRCTHEKHFAYKSYGAKGVMVCEDWLNSYDSFKVWAESNGWRKGLQLDKDIKGNSKLYSPSTCCFVDRVTNSKNKPSAVKHEYNGSFLSLTDIAKIEKISYDGLRERVKKSQTLALAIENTRNYVRGNRKEVK